MRVGPITRNGFTYPLQVCNSPTSIHWTRENLAWVAGIIEGEGSFLLHNETACGRVYPKVSLGMTDPDVVHRVANIIGVGSLYFCPKATRLDEYKWYVHGQFEAYVVMMLLYPWMGVRRRQRIESIVRTWLVQSVDGRVRGEAHPGAKLSMDQVRAIRSEHDGFRGSQRRLAKKFGVSEISVSRLLRGMTYKA